MQRTFAYRRRYPAFYNHELMKWQLEQLGISIQELARRTRQPYETVRKVLNGKSTNKTAAKAADELGLDWCMLHKLDLDQSNFHLAVQGHGGASSAVG